MNTAHVRAPRAFTLLEVMIAMAVFFIVVFAILGVVVQSLGAARSLQKRHADPSMVAAQLSLTNCLEEGSMTGDFEDLYPDQTWEYVVSPLGTNNMLWVVDFFVYEKMKSGKQSVETMQVLFARPACSGAGVRR